MNLITFSDKNYLTHGLTLYRGLKRINSMEAEEGEPNATLHYLCLDDETKTTIDKLISNGESLVSYSLDDIKDISLIKNCKREDNGESPWHYNITPIWINWFLNQTKEPFLYADSDIFFFQDPFDVFMSAVPSSIGLFAHKHMGYEILSRNPGYFNVGVMYFNPSESAKKTIKWWRDICVTPSHSLKHHFGCCGDQKYLELFPMIAGINNVKLLDEYICQCAPWNFPQHEFIVDDGVIFAKFKDENNFVFSEEKEVIQQLGFIHFSHFRPNFEENSYKEQWDNEWGNILGHDNVSNLYDIYFDEMKRAREDWIIN